MMMLLWPVAHQTQRRLFDRFGRVGKGTWALERVTGVACGELGAGWYDFRRIIFWGGISWSRLGEGAPVHVAGPL